MLRDLQSQFERAGLQEADGLPSPLRRPPTGKGSDWPLALSFLLLAGCFLGASDFGARISEIMRQGVGALLNPMVAIGPARPDVVLVSRKESDRRGVILTVEPRGYLVQVARTAKDGLGQLAQRGGRIGLVVVDGALANAGRVAQQAVALCPRARLVVLRGPRQPAQVAARVLPRL